MCNTWPYTLPPNLPLKSLTAHSPVDCRCFLSFVFLSVARRLELSPCNTQPGLHWRTVDHSNQNLQSVLKSTPMPSWPLDRRNLSGRERLCRKIQAVELCISDVNASPSPVTAAWNRQDTRTLCACCRCSEFHATLFCPVLSGVSQVPPHRLRALSISHVSPNNCRLMLHGC